jgi:tetratricopeptide (TPR) repeat protein
MFKRLFGGEDDDDLSTYTDIHSLMETFDDDRTSGSASFSISHSESSFSDNGLTGLDKEIRGLHMRACQTMRAGYFGKAIHVFDGIVKKLRDRLGEKNPRTATALHNLGIANLRSGNLSEAKRVMEETVRLRKELKDPKLADSLVELGIIEIAQKEYADGIEAFFKALKIREEEAQEVVIPKDISEAKLRVAKVHNNLGCAFYERGDLDEATRAFDAAVKLQRSALKTFFLPDPITRPGYLTLASTLCNRGYVDIREDSYQQAISRFKESLELQRDLLHKDDKMILETLDCLAFCFLTKHDYKTAYQNYQDVYEYQVNSYSTKAKDHALTLRKVIYCSLKLNKYDEALQYLRTLEELQREVYSEDSNQVNETLRLLAQVTYQTLKFPTLGRVFDCVCGGSEADAPKFHNWKPKKPRNGSKMSGHRVTCP